MTWLIDPVTREPLPAWTPGDRSLRPLSIYADIDYERTPRMTEPREPTFDEAEKEAAKPPEPIPGTEDLPDDVRDGRIDDDAPVEPTTEDPA